MIKRPLLWGIGALVLGILQAWHKIPLPFMVLPTIICWLLVYLLIFYKRLIIHKDSFLWGLPILMLIGFLTMSDQMKPPDMDKAFEEKISCHLIGKISMINKNSWGRVFYLLDNRVTLPDGNTYLVEEIIVNLPNTETYQEYRIGNQLTVSGTISRFSKNTNPGGFNQKLYYKIQNIDYKVNAKEIQIKNPSYSKFRYILNNIKGELIKSYKKILPEKETGILMAMVLGEKYLLGEDINILYQENGISHILAISGLHVSLIGAAIYFCLRKLRLGLVASTILSLAFVYSYGIFTNLTVSTNRAVVMYSVLLVANLIGKTFDILSALSLSALIILIPNPMELLSAGFLLSFGAVLGIALFIPCFNVLYKPEKTLIKSIYSSVSVQILTLPFILYFFFQIPIYSTFINLLVLPLTSLLVILAIIAGIIGIIYFPAGVFVAGGANYILKFYELICRLGSKLPCNLITIGRPNIIQILIYYLLIVIFIIGVYRYKKKRCLVILVAAVIILIFPRPKQGLTITMLDVGQGESIFLETREGTTFLIDGGSIDVSKVGLYRIRPYLLSIGIDHIDFAIVTHGDTDHISGLMELMGDGKVGITNLVLPKIKGSIYRGELNSEKEEEFSELEKQAIKKKINIMYIKTGDYIQEGMLHITCLHPDEAYNYSSRNAYSTVLSVSYGEFDMLLTGDIELDGELIIRKRLEEGFVKKVETALSDYDVLKVAHHGSRNSTSEDFLSIVQPELALISCGKDNNTTTRLIQFNG